ncbi:MULTISPECIES: virulence associated protein [unclassified Rhizobium]|uniref:virulence associated protein n=1 Tax=unclassified Rhizobium TaxID=2613769 RepID=UPI002180BA07|nr:MULTISPECIES: virulence associated protein [unclassified Rhizobium]
MFANGERIGFTIRYFANKLSDMTPTHIKWLHKTDEVIKTADDAVVEIWELNHEEDVDVLSAWAKHFRQHYCLDEELADLVSGTGKSNAEFLTEIKFPSAKVGSGPATRSGDFGEILVADYIEFILGYWCPREHRYENRINANVSDNGTDVVGFRFVAEKPNPKDELFVVESKSGLRPTKENRLQRAVNDSAKDRLREAMTLSALKKRLLRKNRESALRVERFQNEADRPFTRWSGAVAVLDVETAATMELDKTDVSDHPNKENLKLVVIKGISMMDLVHALYERAANEA